MKPISRHTTPTTPLVPHILSTDEKPSQSAGKKRALDDRRSQSSDDGERVNSPIKTSSTTELQVRAAFNKRPKLTDDETSFATKIDDTMVRSMLSAYTISSRRQSKYVVKEEHSVSTDFRKGVECLRHLGDRSSHQAPNFQDAISHFESASSAAVPEIALSSCHNLILIYKNNESNEQPAIQQEHLMGAIRQGLQRANDMRNDSALVNFDASEGSQKLHQSIASIYAHAMDHWDSFTAEEREKLTSEIFNEIGRNEIFLEIVEGPFRKNLLPNLLNSDAKQSLVEKLKERKALNESYTSKKHPDNFIKAVVSAAPALLLDVHAEQFKEEKTAENLKIVLSAIKAFHKDSSKFAPGQKGLVVRYADLFNHAVDPAMKAQIASDAVAIANDILGDFSLDKYSSNKSAQDAFSSFAMADMAIYHLLQGGTIDAEISKRILRQLMECTQTIRCSYFDTARDTFEKKYDEEQRDFLYRTAYQAVSLIIETQKKLPNKQIETSSENQTFNTLSERLRGYVRSLESYSKETIQSEDPIFTQRNRQLQKHIQDCGE